MSADGSASPIKAESGNTTPAPAAKPTFTDKEEMVLKAAWGCLKGGPPEVDFAKLQVACGFNTSKTTSNTWGVIKKKLAAMAPPAAAAGEDGDGGATPKPKATPKKRTKKADAAAEDGEDGVASPSPAKKPRATPKKATTPKTTKVKAEADEDAEMGDAAAAADGEEGSASPKKKARATPKKATTPKASKAKVKAEPKDDEDAEGEAAAPKEEGTGEE